MTRATPTVLALLTSTALLALAAASARAQESPTPPPAETPAETPQASPAPYDASTVLATVNGTQVTLGFLHLVYLSLPPQYQQLPGETLAPALLEQIINQILLAQAGEKEGFGDRLAVKLAVENTRRDEIAGALVRSIIAANVDDAAIQKNYEEKIAAMPAEQEVNASHILVESEEKAKEIIAQLEGGAEFAELAKQSSDGSSGQNGVLLGWFGRGQMVPPFEEAVFALEPGEISAPVQTQFGWHVIRLNESREKAKPKLEEIRQQIVAELSEAAVRARIETLREGAQIERPETGV
ncbi:MAG TPA: peptidylprolyl isomerase, partial [Paracoccaceae bacterium]|nr:peptidylprolyl isomerase [Paracoccaceae bacterium]